MSSAVTSNHSYIANSSSPTSLSALYAPSLSVVHQDGFASWQRFTQLVHENVTVVINLKKGFKQFYDETITSINNIQDIQEDWEGDGELKVDIESIKRAISFVEYIQCSSRGNSLSEDWRPFVYANAKGGVCLYWKPGNGQFALTFDPGNNLIELMQKKHDLKSTFDFVSEQEANARLQDTIHHAL